MSQADVWDRSARLCSRRQLDFGEDLFVVGSHANLGAWDPARGVQMTWTDGDVWQVWLRCFTGPFVCLCRPNSLRRSERVASRRFCCFLPQASVALPRNEEVEFKLVRRLKDGSFVFSEVGGSPFPCLTGCLGLQGCNATSQACCSASP